jgi:hypothetical protein
VLGTPPAFVLSQDQTLREELLTESCQEYHPSLAALRTVSQNQTGKTWVSPLVEETLASTPGR